MRRGGYLSLCDTASSLLTHGSARREPANGIVCAVLVARDDKRRHGEVKVARNVGHVLDVVDAAVHCGQDDDGGLVAAVLLVREGVDEEEGGLGGADHFIVGVKVGWAGQDEGETWKR